MDANQSALKIVGIPELDDVLGINLFENSVIAQKKENLVKEGLIRFQAPLNFEDIKNNGFYIPTKSGTAFIDWNVSIIDSGFLVQIQDISECRDEEPLQSEEKYRSFFEDDLTGDFIATPKGKILECNPAFAEIYGFDSCEQAYNSDFSKFNPKDWAGLMVRLKNEDKIRSHQSWHVRLDGKEIHVVANVVGIFSDSGELVQVKGYVFDDTDRKKAEEALIESEGKYRRLFDEDLTGDFIATPEGKILECNPAFAEIYGFSNCKHMFQSDISSFNPDDWKNLIKILKTDHKVQGHQSTHKRPDGKQIYVVSNVVAIFDEFKQLVQVKGYVFDDTDRKKAEKALIESEGKYRRLFDEDLTGDFIATPEGKILECNPAFAEIYGFRGCEKAVRSEISQFSPTGWGSLIDHVREEREIQGYQRWHLRPDGKEIHVVANVVGIFSDSGELVQVKGYVFDDTDRKKAEEALIESEGKYRRLFDEDLTGDFIATPEGKILECNPAFAEIYGFDDYKKALKWNFSKSNPFDWPYMVTRLKSEGKIKGYQSWQRRSDGLKIHVVANVVGIFNDSGELNQVKGYVFDDTDRKKTEEKLNHSKRQIAEILDSIQDGFIALNPYWNFIYVNQRAAQYIGVEPDDLIGQNLWERFPELTGTTYERAFRRARDEEEMQYFEAPGIRMNDHWFAISVYPLNEGISVYWRDITPRKKPEKN